MFGGGLICGAAGYLVSCPFFQIKNRVQSEAGRLAMRLDPKLYLGLGGHEGGSVSLAALVDFVCRDHALLSLDGPEDAVCCLGLGASQAVLAAADVVRAAVEELLGAPKIGERAVRCPHGLKAVHTRAHNSTTSLVSVRMYGRHPFNVTRNIQTLAFSDSLWRCFRCFCGASGSRQARTTRRLRRCGVPW